VTASPEVRLRRLWVPNKLVSEEEYAKAMAESDRQRQRYLARFYDVREELPTHYDLILNTDHLRLDQAINAIVAVATH
jgi:cytidylate kinase